MKEIKVDNEKLYEDAKKYFENSKDTIEVPKDSRRLNSVSGNIYGIYVNDQIKYIGERQSGKITTRLNQHLHRCSEKTQSKLKEVECAFAAGEKVSYKTLLIVPDYERYALETYLIQNIDNLEWNIKEKGKMKTIKSVEISSDENIEFVLTNNE